MKILILLIAIIQCIFAGEESVRVIGRMLCHGKPAQFVELQLVSEHPIGENSHWSALSKWQFSGGTKFAKDVFTDPDGYFDISGYIYNSHWTPIDARLYVWHTCMEKEYELIDPCFNRFKLSIPRIKVSEGPLADKTWNIGEFELKEWKSGQSLWCND
ncbi:CBN-SDZ-22 protein [Caenorhabditis brenneri]|uniref:CBN-SDZ-22 protein n=1 Tax=Caenorhabditis brenneri TaxID=135651 RepID=G0P5X3_CAEBE|nr:CBN-SDZ-22 protein [Caenorhabditis brenneri]